MTSRCVCQSAPVRALVVPVCCERKKERKQPPQGRDGRNFAADDIQDVWQPPRWLSVLSCGSVCRSCVTVIARLASTHTALVSQSLVGLCFAFPSINQVRLV